MNIFLYSLFFILVYSDTFCQSEVKIGNQIWMTKNLDVDRFRNGDTIYFAKSREEFIYASDNMIPSFCYYDFDVQNQVKYGKLYNWYAVNDRRGLAPFGWHIPSDKEWSVLTEHLGTNYAGLKMKSSKGWKKLPKGKGDGDNSSKFNGLPGGHAMGSGFTGITFWGMGMHGGWWSSTQTQEHYAFNRSLDYGNSSVGRLNPYKHFYYSVRCIKD